MIKAEIITHEGNRGPNWLDHCKAMATPWTVTLAVVILAAVLIILTTHNRQTVGQANSQPAASSTPALSLSPLSVQPLTSKSGVQTSTNSVQSAAGGNAGSSTTAASQIGAGSTPSLNTAKTPAASANSTPSSSADNQSVVQPVQSIVDTTLQSVNKTLSNNPLGL